MNQTTEIAVWLLAGVALLVVGCLDSDGRASDAGPRVDANCACNVWAEVERVTGADPVNCSFFDVPGAARMCVAAALAAGQPFVLAQDAHGTDSVFLGWLVGDALGRVSSGFSDDDPSGGSGSCATFSLGRCGAFQIFDSPPSEFDLIFTCSAQEPKTPLCGARN